MFILAGDGSLIGRRKRCDRLASSASAMPTALPLPFEFYSTMARRVVFDNNNNNGTDPRVQRSTKYMAAAAAAAVPCVHGSTAGWPCPLRTFSDGAIMHTIGG